MNIRYFYLDPGTTLKDEYSAPAIHIRETINALRQLGHETRSVLYEDIISQTENAIRRTSREIDQKNPIFHAAKPFLRDVYELYQNMQDGRPLAAIFRENSIDLVYERLAHNKSSVSTFAHKRKIPLIVESNAPVEEKKQYWGAPLDLATRFLEMKVLQRADAITVVSSPLKNYYERIGVAPRKIFVLPNGVNEEIFCPAKVSRNIRAELGLEAKMVIGFVGTIAPYHGVELFLHLARAKMPARTCLHFMIVGAGRGRDELKAALKQENLEAQFTFVDPIPNTEVLNYLAAMDIGLLPRFMWYGSPMKVLEYGAMGKVIVAPDQENIRDLLTHGQTAFLVKPDDPVALVRAIQELAQDEALRERLGTAVRQHILAHHTWIRNAERILEIYRQIVC